MPLDMQGRHAREAPTPIMLWKCPSCGHQNSGRLELGCVSCASGAPGSFVGIDPPARKGQPVQSVQYSTSTPSSSPTQSLPTLDQAWLEWIRPYRGKFDADKEGLLYDAFKAGYLCAVMQSPQAGPPLTGTAESRTIIAALKLFVEHILPTAQEEIVSGEFLNLEETEALIERLGRTI